MNKQGSQIILAVTVTLMMGFVEPVLASHGTRAPPDGNYRENLVALPDGRTLVVVMPDDGESGLSLIGTDGSVTTLIAPGDCIIDCGTGSPKGLMGLGSNPHANAHGVAVFKGVAPDDGDTDDSDDYEDPRGLFMVEPDGTLETIIYAERGGQGDNVGSSTVCGLEPRPYINDSGQIGFAAGLDFNGNTVNPTRICEDDDRKAALRYTPGVGVETMLLADDGINPGDTVTVPPGVGGVPGNYNVDEVRFLENGATRMNEAGQMLVRVVLDGDDGIMRLNAPGDYDVIAVQGGTYNYVNGGYMNASGDVMFRTANSEGSTCCGEGGALRIWSNGVTTTIAEEGDGVPGTADSFQGFPPHFSLNDSGNAAFIATINNDDNDGVFFYNGANGQITEIARLGDSLNGLDFDEIASVAVLTNDNEVYFVGEEDGDEPNCGGDNSQGFYLDGREWTALYRWTAAGGIEQVAREGDLATDGSGFRILNLRINSPELRKHAGSDGRFSILAAVASAGNCIYTDQRLLSLPFKTPSDFDVFEFFNQRTTTIKKTGAIGVGTLMLLAGGLIVGSAWRRRKTRL